MNGLVIVAGILLLAFYWRLYGYKENHAWMVAVGLSIMTLAMLIDGVPLVYVVLTGLSAACAVFGVVYRPP